MKDKWKYQRIERDCSSLPIAVAIYALDHISSRPAAAEPDLAGPRRETARGVPKAEAGARRRTLRAHEEKLHGEYRTQRLVLDAGPCGPTKRNCTGSTERRGWCSTPDLAGPRRETARGVPNAEAGARRLRSHGCRRSRRRSVEARDSRSRLRPTSLRQGSHLR